MTSEDGSKSRKHRMTLLAHGRKIGADATESSSSVLAPKSPRNFLLDLGHAQISLGLIVRKWPRKVIKECEDLLSTLEEGIEQILGGGLFGWSPAFGKSLG